MTGRTARRAHTGYLVVLTACTLVSITWLGLGAAVSIIRYWPAAAAATAAAAAEGSTWALGARLATARTEPLAQAIPDFCFAVANLTIAGLLLVLRPHTWVTRLLALAMVGSAGAFNLQAHATVIMVQTATGISTGVIVQILLHGIGCAAYIAALLLFPAGLSELTPSGGRVRVTPLMRIAAGALIVIGVGTALLPHTVTCILFFGLAVPISGLIILPGRIRQGATAQRRVQARLLFSVLIADVGVSLVLAVLTMVLWSLGTGGDLVLDDPTAHLHFEIPAGPTALLFWFSRLSSVGIATAMLVAIRRPRLWGAERIFSHGLASMIVIVLPVFRRCCGRLVGSEVS